jgi:3-oxoacyl-(acyl-carrier-protein) synthase
MSNSFGFEGNCTCLIFQKSMSHVHQCRYQPYPHHPTFRNKGFSSYLQELDPNSKLVTPDYSDYIPAMERRRMSDVQKMSIACSLDCIQQQGSISPMRSLSVRVWVVA